MCGGIKDLHDDKKKEEKRISQSSLTNGLEVESDQLTAGIPEELRVVVGWIHSGAFRVDPAQLQFVVPEQSWLRTMLHGLQKKLVPLLNCYFFIYSRTKHVL